MAATPTNSFPHVDLTPIPIGTQPNFLTLKVIHQELNGNAMSIPTTRGGGQHRHLALALSTALINAIDGTAPWINPIHPGATPVHANNTTTPQISYGDKSRIQEGKPR